MATVKKDAKLASGEKEKQKYKVTLHVKHYVKDNGYDGIQRIWIKELIK